MYRVKISLADVASAVWRRLVLPADTSLAQLHQIIQAAFGWRNYHLHQYMVDEQYFGEPNPEFADELPPMTDERRHGSVKNSTRRTSTSPLRTRRSRRSGTDPGGAAERVQAGSRRFADRAVPANARVGRSHWKRTRVEFSGPHSRCLVRDSPGGPNRVQTARVHVTAQRGSTGRESPPSPRQPCSTVEAPGVEPM
jgi:hypothetical protein